MSTLQIPPSISDYFEADKAGGDAVAECFAEDAVVRDEGETHQGRAAIKAWKAAASKKYQYTSELLDCEEHEGKTVVTSRLTGNFPGSPVDLRFFFGLSGGKIATLEIIP